VFAGLVLFFAGITSSLAMGTPWMGFMRDEFGWSKIKELGLWSNDFSFRFTNGYFKEGVFDEYDYGLER
jgi:SNF family Na+-dependent transporter